ncbi:hypothetical protein BDZ89DRAFT_1135452 [Hymenopellis radicata]|nr:hypothetical protein BDZ89DRAFT_1135452 [Hymenopellis radicata]
MAWIAFLARDIFGLEPVHSIVMDSAGNQHHVIETEESYQQRARNTIIPIMNRYMENHNIVLYDLEEQPETEPDTEDPIMLQPHIRGRHMTLRETYSRGLRNAGKAVMNSRRAPRPPPDVDGESIRDLLDRYDPNEMYTQS